MSEPGPPPPPPPPGPPPALPPFPEPGAQPYPYAPPDPWELSAEPWAQSPTGPPATTPPSRRWRVVVAVVAAVAVLALAVGVPLGVQAVRDDPTTADTADGPVDLSEVQVFDNLRTDHETGTLDYPQSPPVGGPHNPVWLDCGAYDEPVPNENAVHDLEHGTVWITYDPSLAADDVAALKAQLPQNGIMSPYEGLASPVVVTVWGRQLDLTGAADPRLGLFLATLGAGETAPEPFASCAGGIQPGEAGDGSGGGGVPA